MVKTFTEVRIRYADTDQMQFVYNGKYLEFFEVGRTEMLRQIGMPYKEVEQRGIHLPLIDAYLKYHSPARYDEIVVIEARLEIMPAVKFRIDYTLTSKDDGRVIVTGYTGHAFISTVSKRAVRQPQFIEEIFKPHFK